MTRGCAPADLRRRPARHPADHVLVARCRSDRLADRLGRHPQVVQSLRRANSPSCRTGSSRGRSGRARAVRTGHRARRGGEGRQRRSSPRRRTSAWRRPPRAPLWEQRRGSTAPDLRWSACLRSGRPVRARPPLITSRRGDARATTYRPPGVRVRGAPRDTPDPRRSSVDDDQAGIGWRGEPGPRVPPAPRQEHPRPGPASAPGPAWPGPAGAAGAGVGAAGPDPGRGLRRPGAGHRGVAGGALLPGAGRRRVRGRRGAAGAQCLRHRCA
jgi:hypothetical protein